MKCLRIKFILPNHYPLTFEEGKAIELNLPEGTIQFKINVIKTDIYTSYTLKSEPLEIVIKPETIEIIENALFLSFNKFDIGLLINSKLASGLITEQGKKEFGDNVNSDFIGVKVVDCDAKHISISASLQGGLSGHSFFEYINSNILSKVKIDEKFNRAIELYNSTNYLSRVNNSGRFILLMSSIECLISQEENSKEIIEIIHKAQDEIKNLEVDKDIIDSVVGSLTFMKYKSIKKSGKTLISNLFENCTETFNNLSPEEFFGKAYDLRSKLVHEGRTENKYLDIEKAQMQEFAISTLRKYCLKNYC